jgi:hypothetical protein
MSVATPLHSSSISGILMTQILSRLPPCTMMNSLTPEMLVEHGSAALRSMMLAAFTEQNKHFSGVSCTYIPRGVTAPERKACEDMSDATVLAATEIAQWEAESVRRKHDPNNQFGLEGWSVEYVDGMPAMVNRPLPDNIVKSRSEWEVRRKQYETADYNSFRSKCPF